MKRKTAGVQQNQPAWLQVCDWILRWGITGLLFVVPLIWFPSRIGAAITSKLYFFEGGVLLLSIVFVWVWLADRRYRISGKSLWFFGTVFLFLCSLTVSACLGSDPLTSLFGTIERGTGVIFLWSCFLYSLIISSLIYVHKEKFFKVLLSFNLLASFIVAISTYFSDGGLIGNSSSVGAYFVFSIFLGILLVSKETRIWLRVMWGVILLFIATSPVLVSLRHIGSIFTEPLLVVGSARMAAFSVVVGILLALCIAFILRKGSKITRILAVAALCIILGVGTYFTVTFLNSDSRNNSQLIEQATRTRFIFWDIAKEGIREKPVFGWGPENYRIVYASHFNPIMLDQDYNREGWVDKPHNATLEMFVSGGIVGGVLFIAMILSVLGIIGLLYKRGVFSAVAAALFSGMWIVYVLQNQLFFDGITSYMLMFLCVGILAGFSSADLSHKNEVPSLSRIGVGISVGLSLAGIVLWYLLAVFPAAQIRNISRVVSLAREPGIVSESQYQSFEKGMKSFPIRSSSDFVGYVILNYFDASLENILSQDKNRKEAASYISRVVSTLDTLADRENHLYRFSFVGNALQNTSMVISNEISPEDIARAERYGKQAINLSPTNPQAYMGLAETYIYAKRGDDARALVIKAISLNPRLPELYRFRIRLETFLGTSETLLEARQDARLNFPNEEF